MLSEDPGHEEIQKRRDPIVFEFPLLLGNGTPAPDPMTKHEKLADIIGLSVDDENMYYIFSATAALCDPLTQPEETEDLILSLDSLSDVLIALTYLHIIKNESENGGQNVEFTYPSIESLKFDMSLGFFRLILKLQRALNADDEIRLAACTSVSLWFLNLRIWTPVEELAFKEKELKLCYSMVCVLYMCIYKLFKPKENVPYNLALNPYLQHLIKSWKCYTNIIVLGLALDREELKDMELPIFVKLTIKGASSVRYVLAWILNQNPTLLALTSSENIMESRTNYYDADYDIKSESLINFLQPMVRRKINGGALLIDMRLVIVGLLIINSGISFTAGQVNMERTDSRTSMAERYLNQSKPITELGDLLVDLEYDDQFDEDIQFIFDYELDDLDEEWIDMDDQEERILNNEPENIGKDGKVSTAVRSNVGPDDIEFDEYGNDWRDVPRKENEHFQDWFLKEYELYNRLLSDEKSKSDYFLYNWSEVLKTFEFLALTSIGDDKESEERIGQALINTVSKCIKDESEGATFETESCTPDLIYQYWISSASEEAISLTQNNNKLIVPIFNITQFELLLHNNNKLARCLMDEMLMCPGYRRVLIWFLTHNVNLSALLIDYIFELLAGLRGNKDRQKPYRFTRKGEHVILSEIEILMLLHEFLNNCSVYLSATEGVEIDDGYKIILSESIAKKLMTFICLMINQLIKLGIISLTEEEKHQDGDDIHDYTTELQVLLINWVGRLPEARELFFKLKKANYNKENDSQRKPMQLLDDKDKQNRLIKEYASMSILEISEDLDKLEENVAVLKAYTKRLESSLRCILHNQLSDKEFTLNVIGTDRVIEDFEFFLSNFNTLCKIDFIAEFLFSKFEDLISKGSTSNDVRDDLDTGKEESNEEGRSKELSKGAASNIKKKKLKQRTT